MGVFDKAMEFVSPTHARVAAARESGDRAELADALRELGDIERRPPVARERALKTYAEAAEVYRELGRPLDEAWVLRHIGIIHEYAERLEDAEEYYDRALGLYREHATEDDLNYANAVRYPAVIKERLGKPDESAKLWEEAHDRYSKVHDDGLGEGVAEAAAWLTILALRKNDRAAAEKWFARAAEASARSNDAETHRFIEKVKAAFDEAS